MYYYIYIYLAGAPRFLKPYLEHVLRCRHGDTGSLMSAFAMCVFLGRIFSHVTSVTINWFGLKGVSSCLYIVYKSICLVLLLLFLNLTLEFINLHPKLFQQNTLDPFIRTLFLKCMCEIFFSFYQYITLNVRTYFILFFTSVGCVWRRIFLFTYF